MALASPAKRRGTRTGRPSWGLFSDAGPPATAYLAAVADALRHTGLVGAETPTGAAWPFFVPPAAPPDSAHYLHSHLPGVLGRTDMPERLSLPGSRCRRPWLRIGVNFDCCSLPPFRTSRGRYLPPPLGAATGEVRGVSSAYEPYLDHSGLPDGEKVVDERTAGRMIQDWTSESPLMSGFSGARPEEAEGR